jgi:GNAT superfamily N-acetyltransferase
MNLERFDPATATEQVRACYGIYLAGAPIDEPHEPAMSFPFFRGWLMHGWTEDPSETWLARDVADAPCGWFLLTLPQREDRRYADLRLFVHPARRRAGLGRALAGHAAARAVRAGRAVLTSDARDGSPGEAFAQAIGARRGITEVSRVLELDSVSAPHLARLRCEAEAAAAGYSLLTLEGAIPEEYLAPVAAVTAGAGDFPMDPGREQQHWDAERVRQSGRRVAAQGLRYYTVAGRHDASGSLVALTQVGVDPLVPEWALQEFTAVVPQHRGHRLGLLVKAGMLELLAKREPQLRRVITGNADSNKHMIAINSALGFKVLDRWSSWEMDVAAAITLGPGAEQ